MGPFMKTRGVVVPKNSTRSRIGQLGIMNLDVGSGGALVESTPFNRRVVGSNPALAAT